MTDHELDIAFSAECHTVGHLLQHGLAALERAEPGSSDDMVVPVLLISSGLERVCKLALWRAGRPRVNHGEGHDIGYLLGDVVKYCFTPQYRATRKGEGDYRLLDHDAHVRNFEHLLTKYASAKPGGRYMNIDRLYGTLIPADNAYAAWRTWDSELNGSDAALVKLAHATGGLEYRYAVTRLRVRFVERLLRAVTRLLYSSPRRGRVLISDPLSRFASLPDDALGKTDYICLTHWYDPFRGFRECGLFAYSSESPHSR